MSQMKRVRGFPYYDKGDTCAGCGVKQEGDPEAKPGDYPDDFGGYFLECPECYYPGCDECIVGGRGCMCDECENAAE